ncbi:hypothetical protein [Anaeromyxobacter diazotrophicus]|uniref:Uncharacterized protein n=1 Tax=Anaeromyxobacter diazotrophicus TaxID=2590199 RepID=A0A7I9VGK8_9BACT|nr:hypothetical protein [Anaeromyxobacter diazotrophicus]GEJ55536.1 hypothetical protein AMYX_02770 [Anaeromyxobacter diazotrophicus]
MAETKKGGFHALEERIHQLEEDDKKREQQASAEPERGRGSKRGEGEAAPPAERK